MLKFVTMFPYLDQNATGSAFIKKVDFALPLSKRIMGYFVKFRLKLIEMISNFTSMSEHEIFVYYSNVKVYTSNCFPAQIATAPPW